MPSTSIPPHPPITVPSVSEVFFLSPQVYLVLTVYLWVFKSPSHWGNTNKEISSHPSQNGKIKKAKDNKWHGCEKGITYSLLVGVQTRADTVEVHVEFSQKTGNRSTVWSIFQIHFQTLCIFYFVNSVFSLMSHFFLKWVACFLGI